MMYYGNVKTGTIIFSGAVGELKHLEGGLKDYVQYPEKNGFYAVDNIWDKDNEFSGKKCGFCVPESGAYFGIDDDPSSEFFGQPFIDEHGNSFVERAEAYIRKKREGLIGENAKEAEKEKALPLVYDKIKLDIGYRLDILVENSLVIEIKSVDALSDIHTAQVLTYLKLSGNRLGLLINFNVTLLKNGIKRLVV